MAVSQDRTIQSSTAIVAIDPLGLVLTPALGTNQFDHLSGDFFGFGSGFAGAAAGAVTDVGVDDDFMKELGTQLNEGGAAVILLVRQVTPDKVLDEIGQYGGHVLQSSLSHERETELQAALDRRGAPA